LRIGYLKFGRSIPFDPASWGPQGDAEAVNLLQRLAARNPDHTWVIVGKNDRYMEGMPQNVENVFTEIPHALTTYNQCANAEAAPAGADFHKFQGSAGGFWVRPEGAARDAAASAKIAEVDAVIVHIGQHGCSSIPIPQVASTWEQALADPVHHITHPQVMARNYQEYASRGLNALGDRTNGQAPVIWICVDPRNYVKSRELKWPTGGDMILAQHQFTRKSRHERYGDPRTPEELGFGDWNVPTRAGELWESTHTYKHAGTELMILPDLWETWGRSRWADRKDIGVASTSFWVGKNRDRRSWLIQRLILDTWPNADVYGKWDKKSLADVQIEPTSNTVAEFQWLLNSWKVTVSLPAVGSDWCVAKPYQCFAANVACFIYGRADTQGWILPSRRQTPEATEVADGLWSVRTDWTENDIHLARWLRIEHEDEFVPRAKQLIADAETWGWVVGAQRELLARRWDEKLLERTIESRLGLTSVIE
jgi:hypothetical protein